MSDLTKAKEIQESITIAIGAIKGFAKYLLIPSAVIIFLPDNWLRHIKLLAIKNSGIGMWISIIFWICLSIVLINFLEKILERLNKFLENKRVKKGFNNIMMTLTDSEKRIVYLIFDNDTYNFEVWGNASLKKLTSLGVIYSNLIGGLHTGLSYGLQPMTRQYLLDNPSYLSDIKSK